MDNFEFFKELYFKENERRSEVENALNIPIAVITALCTTIYFLITTFDYSIEVYLNYIFYFSCITTILFVILSIYHLIIAFNNFSKGYDYRGIPYPYELFKWYKELENYYQANSGTNDDAKKHFSDYIVENIAKHTEHNMFVNDLKYRHIYLSKKFLIFGLIGTLCIMIPYSSNFFHKRDIDKKGLVDKISKSRNIKLVSTKTTESMPDKNKKQTPPPPPPPRDRIIKEGQAPPKPKGDK